jgi:ABC-type xylose transport system permease subunit
VSLLCNKILLKTLQKFVELNDTLLIRTLDLCRYSMMNLSEAIHESYVKLLAYIPVNILTSTNLDQSVFLSSDFTSFSRAARINYINASNYSSTFSIHHFKAVMGYMLAGTTQGYLVCFRSPNLLVTLVFIIFKGALLKNLARALVLLMSAK